MTLHHGIFKGGGGKGVLYVGALQELAKRDRWFRAVAGSSAGALTATLVAAGFHPDKLEELARQGLAEIRFFLLGDIGGKPIVRTHRLRSWLDSELRKQLEQIRSPISPEEPVRFEHLGGTSIELFVASVDVVMRQPRVFGTRLTPEVGLVDAVLSSCAIPMAFRQGRMKVIESDGSESVHRLIDGGVYANYPAFIFRDTSFRACHGLDEVDADSTIGFTIQHRVNEQPKPISVEDRWGFESRKDKGSFAARVPLWLWAFGRLYVFVLLPILVAFQMIDLVRGKGLITWRGLALDLPWPIRDGMAFIDGFASQGLLGQWLVWGIVGLLLLFVVLMAVLGFTLLDTGYASARTLMSVGTDVPYWVGHGQRDRVVRLAPPHGLGTFSFRAKPEKVKSYIASARSQAADQLDGFFPKPRSSA